MPKEGLFTGLKGRFRSRRGVSPALSTTLSTDIQSPKGDAKHSLKPSSVATEEPCESPGHPAADADPIPPSKVANVASSHAPAAPSEANQTVTGPTEPRPSTLSTSTSQRLWNAAYDSLEEDDEKLVAAYVKTLGEVLGAGPGDPATDVSAELRDPAKRQVYMAELVEKGQEKISRSAKIMNKVGEVADAVLSIKALVDLAVHSVPQAALPWAGVCVGLQILLNPVKASKSNLSGMAHVISRMEWYCALSEHLLSKKNIAHGNDFQAVLIQLEGSVVGLYKALLKYQMKSICSYYRNQGLVFLRSILNLDDWDGKLKSVTAAEDVVRNDTAQFLQEQTKARLGQLVEHGEGIQARLGDIRQTLQDFIALQTTMRSDDEATACLCDLYVVNPQDDMARIEGNKGTLLYNAYEWILHTDQYITLTTWGESDLSPCRLLWIKGQAGTGKTMLMMGMIRELSSQPAVLAPSLSYFFCQGTGTKKLNTATAALRSLMWMLLVQQPDLIIHLQNAYKKSGPGLFNDGNEFYALKRVFENMLKDPALLPAYLIIDALDEFDRTKPGLEELIQLISTSLTLSENVKWLLSSRPEVDMLSKLGEYDPRHLRASESMVELDTERLEGPVSAYIEHKLSQLKGSKLGHTYTDDILRTVSTIIHQRAKDNFLWVFLVFNDLASVRGSYAAKNIKDYPSDLAMLYDHKMDRIELEETRHLQHCRDVLVVTLLAYRPLSLDEIAVLVPWASDTDPYTIIEKCNSFLAVAGELVTLIHQSAKDYLGEKYTSKLQPAGPVQGHADIATRSIDAMFSSLKRNMYNLRFGFKPEDMTPPNPDPLAAMRYSCVFWADHLCFLDDKGPECTRELVVDDGPVFKFLKEHFLHWLESLSLLGRVSDGLLSVRKLLASAQSQPDASPHLVKLLKDTERFILSHRSIIERAPMQTYSSALVFSPTMSDVRNMFWEERASPIKSVAGIINHWGEHRQTLEGHADSVNVVAFSPDGRTLASTSTDGTIRLWDAATGTHQQTLTPVSKDDAISTGSSPPPRKEQYSDRRRRSIKCLAFSSDGKTLASASGDFVVRLWNIETGTYRQTIDGNGGVVNAVTFSHDARMLASASDDNRISLWDIETGRCQRILEGHTKPVRVVAFSYDDKLLVSASDDESSRLWDVATGKHQQTLQDNGEEAFAMTFSPDSKVLASSAKYSHTIMFWDIATNMLQRSVEDGDWVNALAFSHDGSILASASEDGNIRLWEPSTGTHQRTLEGHSAEVMAIAFSPDSKILASASKDYTVGVWDLAAGIQQQLTVEGHRSEVNDVTLSHDGKTLASASDDHTVRLWDVATGTHQQTLEGHDLQVNAVAFSYDDKILASGSFDDTIRLWDAGSGIHLKTLKGHSSYISCLAFSHDSKTLVSAAGDRTIRLWDVPRGKLQETLEVDSYPTEIAFSEDGWHLETEDQVWFTGTRSDRVKTLRDRKRRSTPLHVDETWVRRHGEQILWLPPKYRAKCDTVHGDTLVLGHSTGQITFLYF